MAMVQLKGGTIFPIQPVKTTTSLQMSSFNVNTSDFAASAFIAQKSGVLETVEFQGSGTAATFRVSVQARNSSDGNPSGTNLVYRDIAVGANGWYIPGKMTSNGTDGGTPLTLVKGDIYFIKMIATAGVGFASNVAVAQPANLYNVNDQGSGVLRGGAPLSLGIRFSDGSFYATSPFSIQSKTILGSAINTGTTPDEVGTLFSFPTNVLIGGISVLCDLDGDAELRIYDIEDSTLTPLRTVAVDKDLRTDSNQGEIFAMFPDLLISANHLYVATIRPTSATSLTPIGYTVNASAQLALMGGAHPWSWVQRTDNGSFSETPTQRPLISLYVTGADQEIGGSPTTGFEGEA